MCFYYFVCVVCVALLYAPELAIMATGDSSKGLQELIDEINSEQHYRVIPKAEYDKLIRGANDKKGPLTPFQLQKTLLDFQSAGAKHKVDGKTPPLTPKFSSTMMSEYPVCHNASRVKIPTFSGNDLKGDVSFDVWAYEVRCLKNQLTENDLLQLVRSSLKGQAREMLIPLGEGATIDTILSKLEDFFGNVSTPENIMQNFYSDHQKEGESIVSYGSRLEQCITKAVRLGHIDASAKDAMLRSKFWSGLASAQLRNASRLKYETVKDFQSLLREVRQIEQEENSLKSVTSVPKSQASVASIDSLTIQNSEIRTMQKQLSELISHMKKLDSRIDKMEQNQAFGSNNSDSFQANSSNSGNYRGNFRGRHKKGRGNYSNQQQNQQQPQLQQTLQQPQMQQQPQSQQQYQPQHQQQYQHSTQQSGNITGFGRGSTLN